MTRSMSMTASMAASATLAFWGFASRPAGSGPARPGPRRPRERRGRRGRCGGGGGGAVFALWGPPWDGAEGRGGPFGWPADRRGGDWSELGQLGAYGAGLRPQFNGFGRADLVEVAAPPMLA